MALDGVGDWYLGPSVFVEYSNLCLGLRDLLQRVGVDWIVVSQPNSCGRGDGCFLGDLLYGWEQLPELSCDHAKPATL